jgi:hypothetical protein
LVAGYTTCFGFPAVADHFVPPASARFSAFLSQLAPNGSQLSYSTCFGGTGGVAATGVALGANGVLLTGLGGSNMVLSPDSGTVGTVLFSELELSNRCDVNQDGREDLLDVQSVTNEALGVTTAVHDLNGDGAVTVVDVQMVIGAVLGAPCQ